MNEPAPTNNYAQLLTVSSSENSASEIESYLRKAGLPVKMVWLKPTEDLNDQLRLQKPDLLFVDDALLKKHTDILGLCTRALPYTPVLLLAKKMNAEMVTRALRQRARAVVSLTYPEHLHAIYLRELGVCRLQQQLLSSQQEVAALEERLEGLISSSEDGVLNVQEGIIIDSNPRIAEILGLGSVTESVGMPFMDYIHADSQKEVKRLMSRCLKGRGIKINNAITAVNANGEIFPAELDMKLVHFEGEVVIEAIIKTVEQQVATEPAPPPVKEKIVSAPQDNVETPVANKKKALTKDSEDPRIKFYKTLENPKHYPPNGSGLSLGYFVVDNSAKIKQELGLAHAEQFLGRITTFLNKQIPGANVYRLSTDEFVLIAPGKLFKHGEALSRNFCEQINKEIFDYGGKSIMLTLSIAINLIDLARNCGAGFAEARDDARALSSEGGNAVKVCKTAQKLAQTDEPIQSTELQKALSNNLLRLATRPIASLEGDTRYYHEAYPRMPDEKGKLKAIENGGPQNTHIDLQKKLDRKLVSLAMSILKDAQSNDEKSGIFIPISSCSLEDSENLFSWILQEHQKHALGSQEIVFTLSEEVLMPHIHRLKDLITRLKGKPIKFAVTECSGTEQSLRLIQNVPGHFLHLTAAATRVLCDAKNSKSEGLHEAVSIAKEHNYKIIASSTGDAHSMAVLWQLGVNYVESSEIEEPMETAAA